MSDDDGQQVIDAEVVPAGAEPSEQHALVPTAPAGATLAVTPNVKAADLVERLNVIREAAESAMTEGVDYGNVPGTNKPTLFKPGAEKLNVLFQLDVQLDNEKRWGPGDHLTVLSRATVYHAPTGARLGFGEGMCSTREKKYAYRQAQRICPACGVAAIIKGKQEYGGGWVCFKKKDGCGAKYDDNDQQIVGQVVGQVDNPDLPDAWNTVVKMAEKRARVDAVLAVTGASALFTQDIEDQQPAEQAAGTPSSGASDAHTPPPAEPDRDPVETIDPAWAQNILDAFDEKGIANLDVTRLLGDVGDQACQKAAADGQELSTAGIQKRVAMLAPGQATDLERAMDAL